jgi:hypothetical protein
MWDTSGYVFSGIGYILISGRDGREDGPFFLVSFRALRVCTCRFKFSI